MTLLSWIRYVPHKLGELSGPGHLEYTDVSVVIPVKDNQLGIDRFLTTLFATHSRDVLPGEIIIVDNRSSVPVSILEEFNKFGIPIRVLSCSRPGPACARNCGAAAATGDWLLFTDSDCIPTASFIPGYSTAINGALAYAGNVKAAHSDLLSRYYESQEILIPPKVHDERPQYLITANALIWREAFLEAGGFDERFRFAGGEDVDLGFRLSSIGSLSYAPAAMVQHDFSDGFKGFFRRFVRYGAGNRQLADRYGIDLRPRPFLPNVSSVFNGTVALMQFFALAWGYCTTRSASERHN